MSRSWWLVGSVVVFSSVIFSMLGGGAQAYNSLLQYEISNTVKIYIFGCISGTVFLPISSYIFKKIVRYLFLPRDEGGHDLYGLDHGILNLEVPPRSMWMNMGFWKETENFTTACRSLLDEVLMAAGFLWPDKTPLNQSNTDKFRIIDLGFGCGDQTMYLTQLVRKVPSAKGNSTETEGHRLFDSYAGLTIVPSQFRFANERLQSLSVTTRIRTKLFCADAAKPATWTTEIHEAIRGISLKETGAEKSTQATWVLALDTLYHFIPSRDPIFRYAFQKLNASIMAFDLLLCATPSMWDLILLRVVCLFAAIPFSNFMTITEYKRRLVATGYDETSIEIRDISDHVFAGIADFIERQDTDLKMIGMSVGKYRGAGKLFKWWARSGVVRGCIVVARR